MKAIMLVVMLSVGLFGGRTAMAELDPSIGAEGRGVRPESARERLRLQREIEYYRTLRPKYITLGGGLGLSIPIDSTERILAAEAIINWKWLHFYFHDIEGFGISVNTRLSLGRFTLMPICLGFMYHYDGTAYEMIGKSGFELVTPIALEIKVTKRLAIRIGATWHWPNPFTAYGEAKRIVKKEIGDFIDQYGEIVDGELMFGDIEYPEFSSIDDVIIDSFEHALHNPRIGISFRWYLF